MASKLIVLLLACLLVVTSWANDNIGNLVAGLDSADLKDYMHWYNTNGDVDTQRATWLIPRALATVTITETVCGPDGHDGPTSSANPTGESAPLISIPETSLVTATGTGPASAPTTEQPPAVSGTGSAPSAVEPSSDGTSSSGQTTTNQVSSSTLSASTSADGPEVPTETSDSPSATAEPTLNAGVRQGGTGTLAVAFALTFVRFFGF